MSAEMELVVQHIRAVGRDVLSVVLAHKKSALLPGATPGAHIDLVLPNGLVRQYSVVNALGHAQQESYEVAVGWDANSRGGSQWIHQQLRMGQTLKASTPRNLFEMDPAHRKVLLLAGGIGVTPIYAMAQQCAQQGLDWELWLCARSAPRLAYLEELRALAGPRLLTHFDDEHAGRIDLNAKLLQRRWDAVYACGPAPMLEALDAATQTWPADAVRIERFKAPEAPAHDRQAFTVVLQRSGCEAVVAPHESVLDAMERLGVDHPCSCREGICGTCEVGVLEGEVQHLDFVFSEEEKRANQRMMICVSRCAGERLVLDI